MKAEAYNAIPSPEPDEAIAAFKPSTTLLLGASMSTAKSCPHWHETPVDLQFDESSENATLWACTNGEGACHHPVVKCSHADCGTYNRTIAQVCTRCQKPLNLKKIERDSLHRLALTTDPVLVQTIHFNVETRSITEIFLARGYLFVRTDTGMSVFNAYRPNKLLLKIEGEDDRELARLTLVETKKNGEKLSPPHVLFSTPRRVLRLNFLPELAYSEEAALPFDEVVFRYRPFVTSKGLLHFIHKASNNRLALWAKRSGELVWEGEPHVGFPLQAVDGKVVFYTPYAAYVYSPDTDRLKEISASSTLSVVSNAVYQVSQNEIFIPGEDILYRLKLNSDNPFLEPVGRKMTGFYRVGASEDETEIYIGDESGISICNSFTGDLIWSSFSLIFAKLSCEQFPPVSFGPVLVFVALTRTGRKVELLDLRGKNRLLRTEPGEKTFHVPPLICGNQLICATSDGQNRPELKIFKLK